MKFASIFKEVHQMLPRLELRREEPMLEHCSFRVGGPAAVMALPSSAAEMESLCRVLRRMGVKPLVLGNGTNILPPDRGLDRFVIVTCPAIGKVAVEGTALTAECGATLAAAAMAAAEAGLTGLEFAQGIPGSVGGGVVMNAGAYGGEMGQVVAWTRYLDENLRVCQIAGPEHAFSYRHSLFTDRESVILQTCFALAPGNRQTIQDTMRQLSARRRASQPLDMPSAGSTFKRPAHGFAATLIEEAGLKGCAIGGARVSEKHAGFIVNAGGATCQDILRLMDTVRSTVLKRTGVALEPEVLVLGEER